MKSCLRLPTWFYIIFAVTMIFALIFHWQHILLYAPYLFILACPLMHLFHGYSEHDCANKQKDGAEHHK